MFKILTHVFTLIQVQYEYMRTYRVVRGIVLRSYASVSVLLSPCGFLFKPKCFWVDESRYKIVGCVSTKVRESELRYKKSWAPRRGTTVCHTYICAYGSKFGLADINFAQRDHG